MRKMHRFEIPNTEEDCEKEQHSHNFNGDNFNSRADHEEAFHLSLPPHY